MLFGGRGGTRTPRNYKEKLEGGRRKPQTRRGRKGYERVCTKSQKERGHWDRGKGRGKKKRMGWDPPLRVWKMKTGGRKGESPWENKKKGKGALVTIERGRAAFRQGGLINEGSKEGKKFQGEKLLLKARWWKGKKKGEQKTGKGTKMEKTEETGKTKGDWTTKLEKGYDSI